MENHNLHVAVDIGGTFTDLVIFNSKDFSINILKISSTPKNPETAVLSALQESNIDPYEVALINHASTIATNALLTHTGLSKTALITNEGFRDILEIGRQRRSELYNLKFTKPTPLVPRKYRFTVKGRILSNGEELEKISTEDVLKIKRKLKKERIESVAISFLNSYTNPSHEMKVRELLNDFSGSVCISSEIDPEYREYERTSTTVVNATLSMIVSTYLIKFREQLNALNFKAPLYMMSSSGGLSNVEYAVKIPISVIESGPTAGVLASKYFANLLNYKNILTFDMGGTTAKAGSVINGVPDISFEFEAAGKTHSGRSIKGSGYPVRYPFIDLAEVSAGGGTIAWVDEAGGIRVGPKSAGADPGPAAYGKGGTDPTITDANIVLRRLNPEHLLGGKMPIYSELAHDAIKKKIAEKVGLDVIQSAEGILRLINTTMAKAIAIVSVERSRDPRDFTLFAFGGAGPLHACDLAEEMGIKEILIPQYPGLFSAYGLLTVDITRIFTKPVVDQSISLESYFKDLRDFAARTLETEGFETFRFQESVDVRYLGQSYELNLPYSNDSNVREMFDKEHKKLYGYSSKDPIETVNIKILASIPIPKIRLNKYIANDSKASHYYRDVWFFESFIQTPIFFRENLEIGVKGNGPAIIESYDSTIVIKPYWNWQVDDYKNIVLRRDER